MRAGVAPSDFHVANARMNRSAVVAHLHLAELMRLDSLRTCIGSGAGKGIAACVLADSAQDVGKGQRTWNDTATKAGSIARK